MDVVHLLWSGHLGLSDGLLLDAILFVKLPELVHCDMCGRELVLEGPCSISEGHASPFQLCIITQEEPYLLLGERVLEDLLAFYLTTGCKTYLILSHMIYHDRVLYLFAYLVDPRIGSVQVLGQGPYRHVGPPDVTRFLVAISAELNDAFRGLNVIFHGKYIYKNTYMGRKSF